MAVEKSKYVVQLYFSMDKFLRNFMKVHNDFQQYWMIIILLFRFDS
jgi:hypothetical protein